MAYFIEYCNNPSRYSTWQLREVIADAGTHYENGSAIREWYENVLTTLSAYTSSTAFPPFSADKANFFLRAAILRLSLGSFIAIVRHSSQKSTKKLS